MRPPGPRTALAGLGVLCLAAYLAGLTTHGLTNWQEAIRCLVAAQMQQRLADAPDGGAWRVLMVPTLHGDVYLAKPPMVYWCQLALAWVGRPLGFGTISEAHLRITTGLSGVLGVLLTYALARRLLRDWPLPFRRDGLDVPDDQARNTWADGAAFWAALFLAGGVLFVRSSRIGELDILLVPFTLATVLGVCSSWRHALTTGRTHVGWIALAALAGCGAALTKGPPAILALAIACYGGVLAWAVYSPDARPSRPRSLWWTLGKTHPVAVLGLPALTFVAWGWLVKKTAGAGTVAAEFAEEKADNLNLLVAEAPLNNLEAMAYGVGIGSAAAIVALVWLVKDRRSLRGWWAPGWFVVAAWSLGMFVAFSVLGKGVPRYLTPMWPALAILGGMWFSAAVRDLAWARHASRGVLIAGAALVLAQGWWYGFGRERTYPHRSPRAFVEELRNPALGVDFSRLHAFEFWTPALDFYAGQKIEGIQLGDGSTRPGLRYLDATTLSDLKADLLANGPATLLVRASQVPGMDDRSAEELLNAAGIGFDVLLTRASFVIDNNRVKVVALRVRAE